MSRFGKFSVKNLGLGLGLMGLAMAALPVAAEEAQTRPPAKSSRFSLDGKFDAAAAIKGQKHIDRAMNVPMDDLIKKAVILDAESMYAYGLGLELGRAPAVLSQGDKVRFERAFSGVMDLYLTSRDKINLTGREEALLKEPEFWLLIARHLGRRQMEGAPLIMAGPDGRDLGMSSVTIETFNLSSQNIEEKEFNLNKNTILPRGVTYAAESCVKAGKAKAQMVAVQKVDISQVPHLTPEKLTDLKTEAARVESLSDSAGPDACGSKEYYIRVYGFAAGNLGKLGQIAGASTQPDQNIPEASKVLNPLKP